VEPRGSSRLVLARIGSHRIRFFSNDSDGPVSGDRIPLRLNLRLASWFDPASGAAIHPIP
jgi:hypothetical protein